MFIIPLIIITSFMAIMNVIAIIWVVVIHYKDKRSLQEHSNLLYILMKKLSYSSNDISDIKQLYSDLSSSIDLYNEEQDRRINTTVYPSPQLIKSIEMSIDDYLGIEMILSSDLRIVKSDSIQKIMKMLIKTYPNVDKEYLIKKCSAYIKDMMENPKMENNENQ